MTHKDEKPYDYSAFTNIFLNRASLGMQKIFTRDSLVPAGLAVQEWRAFLNLAQYGNCHLRELARLASLDASHASRATLELERMGYIRRYDDAADARRKRLVITDEGQKVVDDIWAEALELDARLEAGIGRTRYKNLKAALVAVMEFSQRELEGASGLDAAE